MSIYREDVARKVRPETDVVRNIRSLIVLRGLTQKAVAEQLGLHPVHFNRILSSTYEISLRHVVAASRILKVPVADLFLTQRDFAEKFIDENHEICAAS